jgi:predicted Zn-dependent peptidase
LLLIFLSFVISHVQVVHAAAFQGDPLGRSRLEMLQNCQNITPDDLREHHATNFVGPQVTISAASVNHEQFIKYADQFFVCLSGEIELCFD